MESGNNRHELYKAAPDNIKDLYSGEDTGELLWNIAISIGINGGDSYRKFALAVGDIILGLYKKDSLAQILKDRLQLNVVQINEVITRLKPLLERIPELPNSPSGPVIFTPVTSGPLPVETPDSIEAKPINTNTEPESATNQQIAQVSNEPTVKPLRTFADDVGLSRAHGYGAFRSAEVSGEREDKVVHKSSQDDLVKK
ncbi:hypothetical protein A2392_02210 [Candidatus Kaiserbacteria bacterium RIFOXYB1_FULL_46_14]|uniref:Uncharacterized protein n=1 Tax=Candidatus Kaiserbacteria bacterium RIFOXYB1_FULL_46_14 TaxID=1798531 RepID=A0A1F6FI83_9BACT|nr:MAG: hypothetical protein A2392_02210 [Candidatus Kaiserbacteria bacterium RIFOXYB1_FULL_46_14]